MIRFWFRFLACFWRICTFWERWFCKKMLVKSVIWEVEIGIGRLENVKSLFVLLSYENYFEPFFMNRWDSWVFQFVQIDVQNHWENWNIVITQPFFVNFFQSLFLNTFSCSNVARLADKKCSREPTHKSRIEFCMNFRTP